MLHGRAFVRGALQGLAYAHRHDVVHGSLSPRTILVDSDGTKRWIPDQATYWNLFRDTTGIKSVDVSTVSSGPELTSGAYLA